jgi:3-oxoacyl-[acyl-carrier-protein] synthase-3
MHKVYINALGTYLPNNAISNGQMEGVLGRVNGKDSRAKRRILYQNGIKSRYYALDDKQQSTHSNAQMAALAAKEALKRSSVLSEDVQLISTGTTQGNLPVPGFASMVHGELLTSACELANFQSVCASGMIALKEGFVRLKQVKRKMHSV